MEVKFNDNASRIWEFLEKNLIVCIYVFFIYTPEKDNKEDITAKYN